AVDAPSSCDQPLDGVLQAVEHRVPGVVSQQPVAPGQAHAPAQVTVGAQPVKRFGELLRRANPYPAAALLAVLACDGAISVDDRRHTLEPAFAQEEREALV